MESARSWSCRLGLVAAGFRLATGLSKVSPSSCSALAGLVGLTATLGDFGMGLVEDGVLLVFFTSFIWSAMACLTATGFTFCLLARALTGALTGALAEALTGASLAAFGAAEDLTPLCLTGVLPGLAFLLLDTGLALPAAFFATVFFTGRFLVCVAALEAADPLRRAALATGGFRALEVLGLADLTAAFFLACGNLETPASWLVQFMPCLITQKSKHAKYLVNF